MALTRKDFAATVLTVLTVVVFAATHEGWNVWLVGDSRRWAAGVIALLGAAACGLGSPGSDTASRLLAALGVATGVLAVIALVTASLTAVSLLTVGIVLLWAGALLRHAAAPGHVAHR